MLNSEQNDEVSDTTKMLRELKFVKKDCFGFASQDDSSNADGNPPSLFKLKATEGRHK